MSGYRPGYSEAHSPTYRDGLADGIADAAAASLCPPGYPEAYSPVGVMYERGYEAGFQPIPCGGCERCQPERFGKDGEHD